MDPEDRHYATSWLAEGLLMEHKINIMFGAEKAGKSRLLGWLLVHILAERTVFGAGTKAPGKLLYMAGEETKPEVTARLVGYQEAAGIPEADIDWASRVTLVEAAGMRLDRKQQREWLRQRLEADNFDMVIIDPLRRVHGASENSNDEMAPIANDLREWTNRYSTTLVIIHHTGKLHADDDETRIATWSRGATDLPAVLDWALYAKRQRHGQKELVKLMRQGRAPSQEPLTIVDKGGVFLPALSVVSPMATGGKGAG